MWSVSTGVCGLYQLVGVVCINWWVWSVSIGGCGVYQLVGVVCINWWVWSVSTGGCGLYQLFIVAILFSDHLWTEYFPLTINVQPIKNMIV